MLSDGVCCSSYVKTASLTKYHIKHSPPLDPNCGRLGLAVGTEYLNYDQILIKHLI